MKKTLVLLFLFILYKSVYSQEYSQDVYQFRKSIKAKFEKYEFYDAIREMDSYLIKYPRAGAIYSDRAVAKLYLNDLIAASQDLVSSYKLSYHGRDLLVKRYASKDFLVNLLTKNYLEEGALNAENGFMPVFGLKDSLQGSLRPERTCFDIWFYDLTVKILPETKSIEGCNQIYFRTTQITNKIQIDLADKFRINSITWKGKELKYTRIFNAIFISFDENLSANENEMITIRYAGIPRVAPSPPWNGGFVWKKKRGHWWVGVACEHLGASSWWPCKDHLTEKPDSMRINIQVPAGYQAISNGNLRSMHPIDKTYNNFEWFVSYPINSYGVTFYMGKFVNFNEVFTNPNGSYNIDYYVLPHHLKKAKKYYNQTKDIVRVYEKLFGEYPYKKDGMAMVEAPYAGMEHQSAIAIGDEYGKYDRRGYENTDYDYLVVHETAHEWWGNTVTMGDMADAWISEGFATYAEYLFMEERFGYEAYLTACSKNMLYIVNIWPIVGPRDVNDNSFIGNDIYHKGATMLNNLRCIIDNDSLFFALIKSFYNQYKFKIVTTSDFISFINITAGKDYTDFFIKFLYDIDPPVLQYEFTLKNDTLVFSYKWTKVGKNFTMPFSITIDDDKNYRLNGTTDDQIFKMANVKSFYLPNEKRFKKNQITKNSFTYYWTSWKH